MAIGLLDYWRNRFARLSAGTAGLFVISLALENEAIFKSQKPLKRVFFFFFIFVKSYIHQRQCRGQVRQCPEALGWR